MRVALHFDDGTVAAYKLGRIIDGEHNHFIHTGETVPIDEFLEGMVKQAEKQFPDAKVVVERLVHHPDKEDEGKWIPLGAFKEGKFEAIDAARTEEVEVSAESKTEGDQKGQRN